MPEMIDKDGTSVDSLAEEGSFFLRFYLDSREGFEDLVADLLQGLPLEKSPDPKLRMANFFRDIEKVACELKPHFPANERRQLELFSEFTSPTSETKDQAKQIGVCRAMAFLHQWTQSNPPILKGDPFRGNETVAVMVLEFSFRLLLEKFIDEHRALENFNHTRHRTLARYLMELLPDSDAIEVEKKCRQDPDWQREKIWISKAVGWIETALQNFTSGDSASPPYPSRKLKFILMERALSSIELLENPQIETPSQLGNGIEKPMPDLVSPNGKDMYLRVISLAGVFVSLIGYFGWLEYINENSAHSVPDDGKADQHELVQDDIDIDQISQLASSRVEKIAHRVLAEQTISTLGEMEKEMEIPSNLFIPEPASATDLKLPKLNDKKPEVFDEHRSSNEIDLKKVLGLKYGYLFRPGKESLGKISEVSLGGGGIYFRRADWPNPAVRFGLPVSNYEMRLGSEDLGFIVIEGEVQRQESERDNNLTSAIHYLTPARAWWLSNKQERIELDLDVLVTH